MLAMFGVSYLLASVFRRICLIKASMLLLVGLSTEVIRAPPSVECWVSRVLQTPWNEPASTQHPLGSLFTYTLYSTLNETL